MAGRDEHEVERCGGAGVAWREVAAGRWLLGLGVLGLGVLGPLGRRSIGLLAMAPQGTFLRTR